MIIHSHPPRTIQCTLPINWTVSSDSSNVAYSLQCLRCFLSLATTNALARGSLKDAANCAKHLELQISEKEKDSERILRVDLVSAHVIGGDRNMQSLKLRSLSGLHMLSQVLRRRVRGIQRVSRFRAALRFQVLVFEFIDVFRFLKTFFSRTLTTSHGITR